MSISLEIAYSIYHITWKWSLPASIKLPHPIKLSFLDLILMSDDFMRPQKISNNVTKRRRNDDHYHGPPIIQVVTMTSLTCKKLPSPHQLFQPTLFHVDPTSPNLFHQNSFPKSWCHHSQKGNADPTPFLKASPRKTRIPPVQHWYTSTTSFLRQTLIPTTTRCSRTSI